ncbi:MAG: phasin family protein [Sphingomonadales bacterium]|nr:phasin family protein [Sphingomonadales bacterium]
MATTTKSKAATKTAAGKLKPAARKVAQKGTAQMNDTVEKITETAKKVGAETKARVETIVADANVRTREAMEKSVKSTEEMVEFSKGNVEALVESSKIAAEGLKSIGEDTAEFARKSFEEASASAKQFAAAKSPADMFKLQGDYARSAFDAIVAQTSKNTEAMLKLVGESMQPVSNRVAMAAEKIKTAA